MAHQTYGQEQQPEAPIIGLISPSLFVSCSPLSIILFFSKFFIAVVVIVTVVTVVTVVLIILILLIIMNIIISLSLYFLMFILYISWIL